MHRNPANEMDRSADATPQRPSKKNRSPSPYQLFFGNSPCDQSQNMMANRYSRNQSNASIASSKASHARSSSSLTKRVSFIDESKAPSLDGSQISQEKVIFENFMLKKLDSTSHRSKHNEDKSNRSYVQERDSKQFWGQSDRESDHPGSSLQRVRKYSQSKSGASGQQPQVKTPLIPPNQLSTEEGVLQGIYEENQAEAD